MPQSEKKMSRRLLGPISLLLFLTTIKILPTYPNLLISAHNVPGLVQIIQGITAGHHYINASMWFAIAYLLNQFLLVYFWGGLVRRSLNAPVPALLTDVASLLFYLATFAVVLYVEFDQPVSGILTTSGAVGLIVAFALRDMILDIFTGLAVNLERPYKIGDMIRVHGLSRPEQNIAGIVIGINWRTTRLKTRDDTVEIFRNSMLSTMTVTNYSLPDLPVRNTHIFVLDFSVPPERALRILLAGATAAVGSGTILSDPLPKVQMLGVNDTGIEYWVRFWSIPKCGSTDEAQHAVMLNILNHLQKAGLHLAHPRQDTYLLRPDKRDFEGRSLQIKHWALAKVGLFQPLLAEEKMYLANAMIRRFYAKGETIIRQGDIRNSSMFFLMEGLLEVYIDVPEGKVKVGSMEPGQFFGELSLLTGEPRSATIIAAVESVAYEVTKDVMAELISKRPELLESIGHIIASHRLRDNKTKLDSAADHHDQENKKDTAMQQLLEGMKDFFRLPS